MICNWEQNFGACNCDRCLARRPNSWTAALRVEGPRLFWKNTAPGEPQPVLYHSEPSKNEGEARSEGGGY